MIWHMMLLFLHHDCESSYTINVQPIHKNMKKILLLLALMVPFVSYAQNEAEKQLTKFEQFSSKTGKISKFVDVNMPKIPKSYMGSLETGIRILMGEKNVYFYRIEEEETSRSIAHIGRLPGRLLCQQRQCILVHETRKVREEHRVHQERRGDNLEFHRRPEKDRRAQGTVRQMNH